MYTIKTKFLQNLVVLKLLAFQRDKISQWQDFREIYGSLIHQQ